MKKNPVSNPQSLSGFETIQLFYPKIFKLNTSQLGQLIQATPASIRNDICDQKFPIKHHKESSAISGRLWFDVRDVAAYLDAQRVQIKRGRKTKASKLAAEAGGDHV